MSGFQAWNSAGVLTIDGTRKPAMISNYLTYGTTDQGYYQVTNPFVDAYSFGFIPVGTYATPSCRWIRLNAGATAFPGADLVMPGTTQLMVSTQNQGVSSGYLDVYNESGSLIWSANSAASCPRILDFLDIPAGYDLQNNTYSKAVGFQPWILHNACPGNISDDGEVVGMSGLVIQWTGSQLNCRYIVKNQRAWSATGQSQGLRIPLAYFTGY